MEKSWVHASEGYDIELVCIVHGDVNSEVSALYTLFYDVFPGSRFAKGERGKVGIKELFEYEKVSRNHKVEVALKT